MSNAQEPTLAYVLGETLVALREYFPDAEFLVANGGEDDPVALMVHVRPNDLDAKTFVDTLDRFDTEWWFNQPWHLQRWVGVYF